MAIYGSFVSGTQRSRAKAGLARSAEIKKRRKEEERTFEREQERGKTRRAVTERKMMEAGETRRAGMREGAATERGRVSATGMMARQRLVGEQQRGAATTRAVRGADVKSMEYARKLTLGDIGHERAMELAKVKGGDALGTLFEESPGGVARRGLPGNEKEYTFSQFSGLNREEQVKYMTHMKSKDPKKYLDFARQYKLLSAPKKEVTDTGSTGRSIYQSDSGTYRNY